MYTMGTILATVFVLSCLWQRLLCDHKAVRREIEYLSDEEDISSVCKDMCRKANVLLHTLSCCDPFVKTHLFSSFCLSLYGAALWKSSSHQMVTSTQQPHENYSFYRWT